MGRSRSGYVCSRTGSDTKKLIRAAVLAADRKGSPPPDLQLALFCGDYHLPDKGAIHDQDYGLMRRMIYLSNTYRTVRRMRGLLGDAINTQLSQSERLLLGDLQEMGVLTGALGDNGV